MKGIAVLGSTGSIGMQTLDIIRLHPTKFKAVSLAAGSNTALLKKQIDEFRPQTVCCGSPQASNILKSTLNPSQNVNLIENISEAVTDTKVDLVVAGLPGSIGLIPTFSAVAAKKDIALATKEVLVMAGKIFMEQVEQARIKLLPVDSEQSAIFQCLEGRNHAAIRRILLTASGGPFRNATQSQMDSVTPEQALKHPRWKMGPKVTIDSSTLMNKGLEVIEASWLFNVPVSKIEVVIHPESIVHSMVEFEDGSILAQIGATDMRIPISYAMAYPERIDSGTSQLDFGTIGSFNFQKPDFHKFPLLKAAFDVALDESGTSSIAYNAADEVAVELFLQGEIPFGKIPRIVLKVLEEIKTEHLPDLSAIMDYHSSIDAKVRASWRDLIR
jgi:1-deoxy-D-xylulose-5-phosphate reductoisomerase